MFPEPQDAYPSFSEHFGVRQVPVSVALDLRGPERSVGEGNVTASGTTVPETAVDEYSYVSLGEEEVRAARNVLGVQDPTSNSVTNECHSEDVFGCFIAFAPN